MKALVFLLILGTLNAKDEPITVTEGSGFLPKIESKEVFNWDAWNARYVKVIVNGREIWVERDKTLAKK